jgi:hypothetical protein
VVIASSIKSRAIIALALVLGLIIGVVLWSARTKPSNTNGDNIESARKYGIGGPW